MEDERLVAFLIAGRLISLLVAGRLSYSVAWIAQDMTATLGFRLFYDHEPVNCLPVSYTHLDVYKRQAS